MDFCYIIIEMRGWIKMRKIIKVLLVFVTMCSVFTVPVSAESTDFYFDLGGGVSDLTKRTLKAGGDVYEKLYYVRPTYFSRKQDYKIRPFRIVREEVRPAVGDYRTIYYKNLNVSKSYAYSGYCPEGDYYFLRGYFIDGPTAQPIHVEGKYTA